MNEFHKCYTGNYYKRVPDAFIRRFGGLMMGNEDFKDVVHFDKTSPTSTLLGASAGGGRLIYGSIRQFENFYGTVNDENIRAPENLKLDKDDFADFCFHSPGKAVLISMAGTLVVLDLESKKVLSSIKQLESSVFCTSVENQDLVFVGNCRTHDLKLIDLRTPKDFKIISTGTGNTLNSTKRKVAPKRKLKSMCNLTEKYVSTGFSTNEDGINVWDFRYLKVKKPVQTLQLTPLNRETFGVYSMQLDRTRTKLFSACTDGCVREYCISSGDLSPENYYCGALSGYFDKSFAISPLTDHFVAPLKDGIGVWDYQDKIELETTLFTRPSTPIFKTPTKTQSPSPSRLFLSAGLAGSPARTLMSPGQVLQQSLAIGPKGKLFGLPSPKFLFKPWNDQPVQHCDWSACGRYIVSTTDTAFTLCDSESQWSRQSANDDHSELKSKFSAYAVPKMDKKNCLPESPVSKKIRFAEDDESIINFKTIMSMRASRPKNQQRAKNVVNSGQVRTYQQSITSFFTGTSDNAFKNRPTVRRGAKSQQIHSDSPTPVFIPAKMGLSKSDRTLFENNHYQEAQSKDVETLPETEEDKKRAVLIKGVNKDFAEEILSAMISTSGIRMADILGNEDAKRALEEAVVLPTLNPSLFSGLREPRKGILLFGPPGNGKTMLAKAVASESDCAFFSISSATIMSKWVGDAERMMQALFQVARNAQPSIIFIDEVDSLLSERKENENGAARRVKTEFLLQFDGCSSRSDDRILVLGATNRPQELDDAIMRRFPRRIYINLPNEKARIDLIKNNFARTNTRMNTTDEQIEAIARKCTNYSFSDLSALCREAAMFPLRSLSREQLKTATLDDLRPITYSDLLEASELVRASTNPENVRRLEDYAERFA